MPIVSKTVLKSYFEDGKEPDENKYIDLIDTMGTVDMDHGGLTGLGDDDHTQYLLADGTRTITGNLTSNNSSYWGSGTSGQISLVIRRPSGQYGFLEFWTGATSPRWRWAIDNDAEGGSNTGSSFSLYRYSDAGGYLGRPIEVTRATGQIQFHSDFQVNANNYFNGGVGIGSIGFVTTSGRLKVTERLYVGTGLYVGDTSPAANPGAGDIETNGQFNLYEGTTHMGEWTAQDTSWSRFNQNINVPIYSPRYFYSALGMRAGLAGTPASGSINYNSNGGLQAYANSTSYSLYGITMYSSELTNASWEARSGGYGPSTIDLSATFGVPAGISAVYVRIITRSSATHPAITNYMTVGPSTTYYGCVSTYSIGSSWYNSCSGWTDCDNNGDIACRISAEGTQTSYLRVWGYSI